MASTGTVRSLRPRSLRSSRTCGKCEVRRLNDCAIQRYDPGGAKKHGEQNFSSGAIKYSIVDKASPIMAGMSDFEIGDEAFFKITWGAIAGGPRPGYGAD